MTIKSSFSFVMASGDYMYIVINSASLPDVFNILCTGFLIIMW